MRTLPRWFLFGLLAGWALTHATVFAQSSGKSDAPADSVRAKLDKKITVDFTGQSLTDVLNHLQDKIGIKIHVDSSFGMMDPNIGIFPPNGNGNPMPAPQQIQVKASDEKASAVLRRVLGAQSLTYILFEDGVFVSTEDAAVVRQMRQRVSVDLEDVPMKKAVRDLAKKHGINLVIDPKVIKQADTPVSLQLDNAGIETTLRLLAELANLKAVRMGNVMYVTTDEKAKKIREEESHQFDNPLNPNLPQMMPPTVRFGIGAAAMGGRAFPLPAPGAVPAPPPGVELPPPPPQQLPVAPVQPSSTPAAPPRQVPQSPPQQVPPPPPPVDGGSAPTGIPRVIRN